ncbi:putative membrane protein YccC [Sporosarcina luteola]|nr:putative membrane protein YccC [Sporosarcina luteola]
MNAIVQFLSGILLLSVLSVVVPLLLPDELEDDFLVIMKIAMGIWIIHSFSAFFGHSLF